MKPRAGLARAQRRERTAEAASAGMALLVAGLVGLTLAGAGPQHGPASRALAERLDRAVDQIEAAAFDQAERALVSLRRLQPVAPPAPAAEAEAPAVESAGDELTRTLEIAAGDTLQDLLTRRAG